MNLPLISFCLSTYNAERYLEHYLTSIRQQNYPQDKIEILVADGGSTDQTLALASKYRCSLEHNSRKLGEFGLVINIKRAKGELLLVTAGDNALVGKEWLKRVTSQFRDPAISAVWGRMIAGKNDPSINHYYTLIQNDPLTWFTNHNLDFYLKVSLSQFDWKHFYVFPSLPLPWGANCLVYRSSVIKSLIENHPLEDYIGDNDIFQLMVEKGNRYVGYNKELLIVHHSISSLWDWVGKWYRNLNKHFIAHYKTRNMRWADLTYGKTIWWVIYSLTPLAFLHSLWLTRRDKNRYWLWHAPATFMQCVVYLWTFKNKWRVVHAICHKK